MGQEVSRYDEDDLPGESGRPRSRGSGHVSKSRERRWSDASLSDGAGDDDDSILAGVELLLAPAERRAPQPRRIQESDSEASVSDDAEDEDNVALVKAESKRPPEEILAPQLLVTEASEPEDDVDQADMDRKEAKRKRKEEKRARKEEKRRRKEEKRFRKQEAALALQEQQSLAVEARPEEEIEAEPELEPEPKPRTDFQAKPRAEAQIDILPPQLPDQSIQAPQVDEKQARKEAKRLRRAAKKAQKEALAVAEQKQAVPVPEAPPANPMDVDVVPGPESPFYVPKEVEVAPEPAPEAEPEPEPEPNTVPYQEPDKPTEAESAAETSGQTIVEDKLARKEAKRLRKEAKKAKKSAALLEANIRQAPAQTEGNVPEVVARVHADSDAGVSMAEEKPRKNKRQRHDATEATAEDEGPVSKRRRSEDDLVEELIATGSHAKAAALGDGGHAIPNHTKQAPERSNAWESADDSVLPSTKHKDEGDQGGVVSDPREQSIELREKAGRGNAILTPFKSSGLETSSLHATRESPSEIFKGQKRGKRLSDSQRTLALENTDAGSHGWFGARRDYSVNASVDEGINAGIDSAQIDSLAAKDDPLAGLTGEERKKAKRKMQKLRGRTRERNERMPGLLNPNLNAPQDAPMEDAPAVAAQEPKEESPVAPLVAPLEEIAHEESPTVEAVEPAQPTKSLQAIANSYADASEAAPVEAPEVVHVEGSEAAPVDTFEAVPVEAPKAAPMEESKAERKKRKRVEKELKKQRKEQRKKQKMQEAEEPEPAQPSAMQQAPDEDEVPNEHPQAASEPNRAIENHDPASLELARESDREPDCEPSVEVASIHDNYVDTASPNVQPAQVDSLTQHEDQDSVFGVLDETDVDGEEMDATVDAGGCDESALEDDHIMSEAPHSPVPDSESEEEEVTKIRAISEELGEDTLFDSIPPAARHDVDLQRDEQLSDPIREKSDAGTESSSKVEDVNDDLEHVAKSAPAEEVDLSSNDDAKLSEVIVTTEQIDDEQDDLPMGENAEDDNLQRTSSTNAKDSPLVTPSRPSRVSRSPSWTFDQYEAVLAVAADYLQTKPENLAHGLSVSVEGLRNFMDENPTLSQWFSLMEQAGITFDRSELIEALQAVAPIDEAVRERLAGEKSQPAHLTGRKEAALQFLSEQVLLHQESGLLSCVKMYHIGEICQELGLFQNGAAEDLPAEGEITESTPVTADSQSGDASPAATAVDTGDGSTTTEDDPPLRRSARARKKKSVEEQNPTPERSRPASVHSVDPRLAKLAMSAMEMYEEHANSENGAAPPQAEAEAESPAVHDTEMGDADGSIHGDIPVDADEESHEQQVSGPELAAPTQREPTELEPAEPEPARRDSANPESANAEPDGAEPTNAEPGDTEPTTAEPLAEEDPLMPASEAQPLIVVHMRSLDSLKPGESFEVLRNGVHALKVSVSDSPADRAFLHGARTEVLKAIRKAMEQSHDPFVEMTDGGDFDGNGGSGSGSDGGSEAEGRDDVPDRQLDDSESQQLHEGSGRQNDEQEDADAQEDMSRREMEAIQQDEQMDVRRDGPEAMRQEDEDERREDASEDEVFQKLQRTRRVANIGKPRTATEMLNADLFASLTANANSSHAPGSSHIPPRNERLTEPATRLHADMTGAPEPGRILEKWERPEKPKDKLCQRCHGPFIKWYFDNAAVHWICRRCYNKDQTALKALGSSRQLFSGEESLEPPQDTPTVPEPHPSRLTPYIPKPADGKCERCHDLNTKSISEWNKWHKSTEPNENWICHRCYTKDLATRPKVLRPDKPFADICPRCGGLGYPWYHNKITDQYNCRKCYDRDCRQKKRERRKQTAAPTARNTPRPNEPTCPACERDIPYHQWKWDSDEVRWTCFACWQRKKRASQRSQQSSEDIDENVTMEDAHQRPDDGSPEIAQGSQDAGRNDQEESSEGVPTAVNDETDPEADGIVDSQMEHEPQTRRAISAAH